MPIRTPTAVYLYCIVRAARRPAVAKVPPGLPRGTRPAAHRLSRSLWLITAEVPLEVYGPDVLEPRLRDLQWVSEAAIAHEAVVEHFSRTRLLAVVPAKLFTMFSSIERAVEETRETQPSIERAMKHIAGSEEWGVRVSRVRPPAAAMAAPARPSSGAAFLTERKRARDASGVLRAAAGAAADAAFLRLGRHAKDVKRRETRQEPGANPPILEAAFLVAAPARARFKAEARRQAAACQAAGAELTLTGPWPAYNFVSPEVD